MKKHKANKGFVLKVTSYKPVWEKSFPSLAQAIYEARRYWNNVPGVTLVQITIGNTLVYEYLVSLQKETVNMSAYSQFRAENPNFDKIPFLDATDRAVFAKMRIPFRITGYRNVDGQYGKQIVCDVKVDTTSDAFKAVSSSADMQSEYQLSLGATSGRVRQFEQLVSKDIEAQKLFILVAVGKSYDLDLLEG